MKTRMLLMIVSLTLACSLSLGNHAYGQEKKTFVVIVHPDNPATAVSKTSVSQMLLKKVTKWDENGFTEDVIPVDRNPASPVRAAFSRDVHGRSVSSIKNYWQRQIFSGRDVPPPELASDNQVTSFVKLNPGAIGYVSSKANLDGVKELDLAPGLTDRVAAPEITNPAIRKIIQSRAARVRELNWYKGLGAVGENNRALVEVRKLDALALEERAAAQKLVRAENADRERMFKEIAAATGADLSQLPQIRSTYWKTLRQNARRGDWIQMPDGSWRQD